MGQSSFGWRTPGDQIIKLVNPVVLNLYKSSKPDKQLKNDNDQMTRVKKNEDIKSLLRLKVIRSKALRQSFHTGSHESPLTE